MWQYRGQVRPSFAQKPGPGQESVWDYPRPPVLEFPDRLVEVLAGEQVIARSRRACRVLETAGPPTYYLPPEDVDWGLLECISGGSSCEWKGRATYWALRPAGKGPEAVGWSYSQPNPAFGAIAGFASFYPGRVSCRVNGEHVLPQDGGFYGGWVTREIVGPWKGAPGTGHW